MGDAVGKVSIKVYPDTSEFRSRTLKKLHSTTNNMHVDVKVFPKLDDTKLVREVKSAHDKAQAAMKDIKLHVDVDDSNSLQRAIGQIDRELAKLREVEINVELNEDDLNAAKQLLNDEFDRTHQIDLELKEKAAQKILNEVNERFDDIEIDIDPKVDPVAWRRARREIEAKLEQIAELKATIDPELDSLQLRKVKRQLESLEDDLKPTVKPKLSESAKLIAQSRLLILARDRFAAIIPYVSKKAAAKVAATMAALSGVRVVNKYFKRLKNFLGDLDRKIPKIAALATGILSLSGYLMAAASNTFAFSAGLAQMFQASLALPGILAGMAIGLGATFAVFKDFNKVLPEVGQKFHDLQDAMSDKFWKVAKAPIRDMIDSLFPEFSKALQSTATELGAFFSLTAQATKTAFKGKLQPMYDNLNESIKVMSKYMFNVVDTIQLLGTVGSKFLPRLADWFGGITTSFHDWLEEAQKTGRFYNWIDVGIKRIHEFGDVLHGLGSIFAGISRAAEKAGGSTLKMAGDTLNAAAKIVNSGHFQGTLTNTLWSAHQAMKAIANESGPQFKHFVDELAEVLQIGLPIAGRTAGKVLGAVFEGLSKKSVTEGFIDGLHGIEKGIDGLLPVIDPVADALGALFRVVGTLAENLGPVLSAAFGPLARLVSALAPPIENVVNILGPALTNFFQSLGAVLDRSLPSIATLASVLLPAMANAIAGVLNGAARLLDFFNDLPGPIKSVVVQLGTVVTLLPFAAKGFAALATARTAAGLGMLAFSTKLKSIGKSGLRLRGGLAAAGVAIGILGSKMDFGSKKANNLAKKVSGTLSGALVGFAVGGPVGAVVGALAGLVTAFASSGKEARSASDKMLKAAGGMRGIGDAAKSAAENIDLASGKLDEFGRKAIATKLQQAGVFDAARKLHIPFATLVDAVEGQDDAIKALSTSVKKYIENVAASGGDVDAAWQDVKGITDIVGDLNVKLGENVQKQKNIAAGVGKNIVAPYQAGIRDVTTKLTPLQTLMDDFRNAAPIKTKFDVAGLDSVKTRAEAYGLTLEDLDQMSIDPQVFLNADEFQIKQIVVRRDLLNLDNTKVDPSVGLGQDPFLLGYNKTNVALGLLDGMRPKPIADLDTKPARDAAKKLGVQLPKGVNAARDGANRAGRGLSNTAASGARGGYGGMVSAGASVGSGLAAGIRAAGARAIAAARSIAAQAVSIVRSVFNSHSPSRVFKSIGHDVGDGLTIGITESSSEVARAAGGMAQSAADVGRSTTRRMISDVTGQVAAMRNAVRHGGSAHLSSSDLRGMSAQVDAELSTEGPIVKQLVYNAAPASAPISDSEQLFKAADRSRMVF